MKQTDIDRFHHAHRKAIERYITKNKVEPDRVRGDLQSNEIRYFIDDRLIMTAQLKTETVIKIKFTNKPK